MLLSLMAFDFVPSSWTPNQGMFTRNRLTNDEVDVTAAIADNDTGPYVFQIPQGDFKPVPEVTILPLGSGFHDGQWYMSSLSATGVGIAKTNVGVGTGTGGIRMFIKRPR